MTSRSAVPVWTLALLCAGGAIALVLTSDHTASKVATIAIAAPTALAFVAAGLVARTQRPENRTGSLLVAAGFAWMLAALPSANEPVLFTAGLLLKDIFLAALVHVLLAFPSGRLEARFDRVVVTAYYALVIGGPPIGALITPNPEGLCEGPCPDNLIAIADLPRLGGVLEAVYVLTLLALAAGVAVRLALRWRRGTPALRRALAPVCCTAVVFVVLVVTTALIAAVSRELAEAVNWLTLVALLAVPLAFLYGLLRTRFGASARRLLAELSEDARPEKLQDALRRVLRDPTLELGYLITGQDGYVAAAGGALALPGPGDRRVVTEFGEGVIVHDASLRNEPELLAEVTSAAWVALQRGLSLMSLEVGERHRSALLDAIPDNVFRVRADGTFLDAHVKRNVGVFGGADAFIGRTVSDILPAAITPMLMAALDGVVATGEAARVEYELPVGGALRHIEARIVRSGHDEVVAITRDVTDLKQSEAALRDLVDAQAALRRVATLAAAVGDRDHEEVFRAVTEEAGRLLGAQTASLVRFAEDGTASVAGGWSGSEVEVIAPGTPVPLDSETPIVQVHRTGKPARLDSYEGLPGTLAARMRDVGWRASVSAPIFVSGRLWGGISVGRTIDEPFPAGAERRVAEFGEIVGIALANAEAREQLAGLAEEQAALSRVAVAVATEERPERLFNIVTEEVARLFGARWGSTVRYDDAAEEVVIVGNWHVTDESPELQLGERFALRGGAISRVKQTGHPARIDYQMDPDETRRQMVAAPIIVSGRLWGATTISVPEPVTFPADAEERLGKFTRLVAVALANAEAREQLTASRARIVQAGDAERRRLERNLHDGAQQRLVSLALALRLAQSRLPHDPTGAGELLARASEELAVGLEELRELARGIHPAILTDRGLAPALQALADRTTVPVEVNGLPQERLPQPIEAAVFYVVSESLTNVAKYASASRARVDVVRDDGLLVVEVSDDGVGGANAEKGSGLRGLTDRVEALGGRLQVSSERGRGTTVRAELPVA